MHFHTFYFRQVSLTWKMFLKSLMLTVLAKCWRMLQKFYQTEINVKPPLMHSQFYIVSHFEMAAEMAVFQLMFLVGIKKGDIIGLNN